MSSNLSLRRCLVTALPAELRNKLNSELSFRIRNRILDSAISSSDEIVHTAFRYSLLSTLKQSADQKLLLHVIKLFLDRTAIKEDSDTSKTIQKVTPGKTKPNKRNKIPSSEQHTKQKSKSIEQKIKTVMQPPSITNTCIEMETNSGDISEQKPNSEENDSITSERSNDVECATPDCCTEVLAPQQNHLVTEERERKRPRQPSSTTTVSDSRPAPSKRSAPVYSFNTYIEIARRTMDTKDAYGWSNLPPSTFGIKCKQSNIFKCDKCMKAIYGTPIDVCTDNCPHESPGGVFIHQNKTVQLLHDASVNSFVETCRSIHQQEENPSILYALICKGPWEKSCTPQNIAKSLDYLCKQAKKLRK